MSFWSRLVSGVGGITANANDPAPAPGTVSEPDWTPGDPDGFELQGEDTFSRSLPALSPSPWSGWPASWSTPNWQSGLQKLVDTAWACLDLNASVLSTMPVYRLRSGRIVEPAMWMTNPDPLIYSSWEEFAKQLFWDYQMGEAFVLPMARRSDGFPLSFRVVPPWLMSVEMDSGRRRYHLGSMDVTDDILHIRYRSTTDNARGIGPLEAGGARMVASELLQRYMGEIAQTGGRTHEWLTVEKLLNKAQADDLREQYVASRQRNPAYPAVLSGGAKLEQASSMNARDMALLELAQFTESRIAILLGVPPFLAGLPSGGDSMTYSNVSSLFDFHDRSSLRPKARMVMTALSGWALPRGQSVELNRDEYSRPALTERATAYEKLSAIGAISADEIRMMERLTGEAPDVAASALAGNGAGTRSRRMQRRFNPDQFRGPDGRWIDMGIFDMPGDPDELVKDMIYHDGLWYQNEGDVGNTGLAIDLDEIPDVRRERNELRKDLRNLQKDVAEQDYPAALEEIRKELADKERELEILEALRRREGVTA